MSEKVVECFEDLEFGPHPYAGSGTDADAIMAQTVISGTDVSVVRGRSARFGNTYGYEKGMYEIRVADDDPIAATPEQITQILKRLARVYYAVDFGCLERPQVIGWNSHTNRLVFEADFKESA